MNTSSGANFLFSRIDFPLMHDGGIYYELEPLKKKNEFEKKIDVKIYLQNFS